VYVNALLKQGKIKIYCKSSYFLCLKKYFLFLPLSCFQKRTIEFYGPPKTHTNYDNTAIVKDAFKRTASVYV